MESMETFVNITMLRHNLINTLTVTKGAIDVMEMGVGGELTQKQKEFLALAKRGLEKTFKLLDELPH